MEYVCRRVEIGRSGSTPETMVKWEGAIPAPYMYFRTTSTVVHAELCGPEDIFTSRWSEVVACAITAGATVGIATIVASPETAVKAFEPAFRDCVAAKIGDYAGKIQVSLSTGLQPDQEWHR